VIDYVSNALQAVCSQTQCVCVGRKQAISSSLSPSSSPAPSQHKVISALGLSPSAEDKNWLQRQELISAMQIVGRFFSLSKKLLSLQHSGLLWRVRLRRLEGFTVLLNACCLLEIAIYISFSLSLTHTHTYICMHSCTDSLTNKKISQLSTTHTLLSPICIFAPQICNLDFNPLP